MQQYLDLQRHIINNGVFKEDRTGTGTKSVFGYQMRFNLQDGFPLITTKKISFRLIESELRWFLRGDTNIKFLLENNNHIWDEWADAEGNLGPVYGKQWRTWDRFIEDTQNPGQCVKGDPIDQIQGVIDQIKTNPDSRRLIVSAWNPADVPSMKLPPCHALFQFYVANGKLSCQLYQRSADVFLGVPFNIASYALLTHIIAKQCDLDVGDFIWTGGDVHLYTNHLDQAQLQITREPKPLPKLVVKTKRENISDYTEADFVLTGYENVHPHIAGKVAV